VRRSGYGGIFFQLLVLVALIFTLALLYVARRPLMRFAGQEWVVDTPPQPSDAIIVLGDDNYAGDRATRAAELYKAGMAPLVVASGHLLRPYVGIAEMISRDLEARGVPPASVLKFPHRAANTREEAEALKGLVVSRGWKRILVVTSNYHTRRARFIFGRVFPTDVTVRVIAAPDSEFNPDRWWKTRLGQKIFLTEVVGYVVARWELRHRARTPGAILLPGAVVLEPGSRAGATLPRFTSPYSIGIVPGLQSQTPIL
jgi:uncharacterized SAM-binding protein YcdF (DUF218 family)